MKSFTRQLLLLCFIIAGIVELRAQASLSFEDFKMLAGDTILFPIEMTNTVGITTIGARVTFPEGITVVQEKNKYVAELYSDRNVSHFISLRQQTDGSYKFLICSLGLGNDILEGTEEPLFYYKITADKDITLGTSDIIISEAELVEPNENYYRPETFIGHITLYKNYSFSITSSIGGSVSCDHMESATSGVFESGTTLTLTATAEDGYDFVHWSDGTTKNPYSFVLNSDSILSASFTPRSYLITYSVGEDLIASDSVVYGGTITAPVAPVKEGYTFAGWEDVPTTMPAHDVAIQGSFTINTYVLVYVVDGAVYQIDSLEYASAITTIDAPVKEGYTFSGWKNVAEVMPAHNDTITGSFAINTYLITYSVGEDLIASDSVVYGGTITAPKTPVKEGYTFTGWEDVPATMPAHDVAIQGSFTVNTYAIIYKVDGVVFYVDSVTYGSPIVLIEGPVEDVYSFSGWITEVPAIMPANDLEIEGFLLKVEIPSIESKSDDGLVRIYTMQGVCIKVGVSMKEATESLPKDFYIINGKKVFLGK